MFSYTLLLTSLLASTSFVNGVRFEQLSVKPRNIQNGVPDGAPPGYSSYISPLVIPSPNVSGSGDWKLAVHKAKAFVAKLTLDEKVNITTGAGIQGRCVGNTGAVPRLGFAGLCLNDSPLSVRFADFVSLFPAGITIASTWDKSLIHRRGIAMGKEHRGKGVNTFLGPMMNLQRAPEAGRIWEGFGGDPYLTGVCSAETIQGVQSQGVIACAKHFIGNEQEHFRGGSGAQAASSNIDDRTMHEIYSWPFAESVRVGVGSEEFNFQGFVVTDWAAAESGVNTALAGTDMLQPSFRSYGQPNQDIPFLANESYWGANLVTALKNGSVPLYRVDDMVTRIMAAYYKMGQDSPDYPKVNFDQFTTDTYLNGVLVNEHVDVQGNHAKLIREIAGAGTVLLKNDNNTLPLDAKSFRRRGIFGSDAGPNIGGPNSCPDRGCDAGTLAEGWGSGTGNYPYLIDPLTALQVYIRKENPRAVVEGILDDFNSAYQQSIARQADICLAFVNANSGEGYITVEGNAGDRNNLTLWHAGDDLISNVTSQCSNTIVVVHAVGPVDMEAWIGNPNVTAVLWANLPGQESGNAIVDVLFGAVNPSAKLPYTIAKHRSDYAADVQYTSNLTVPQITYSEKLLIDYRWFDAKNIVPRFEFGYGLSYTSFDYSHLNIQSSDWSRSKRSSMKPDSLGLYDNLYSVSYDITNSGGVDGHEVSQLYLGFPASAGEPPKVLRGFERTFLSKGQTKTVTLLLRRKDISIWNVVQQKWVVPSGKFQVYVGKSSRNIVLKGTLSQ